MSTCSCTLSMLSLRLCLDSLQSFAQDIYSSVNVQTILPLMIAHGLITRGDQDYFTSTNYILPLEKQERLMFLVISLDEKYVEKFLACLSETDEYAPHGDLLTVIQKGMYAKCSKFLLANPYVSSHAPYL